MKKIKLLLVFVLLLIPCMVMADMGAPSIKPFDMVVVAQDGIDYYDYQENVKGHLNKDDKITICYEYNNNYSFFKEESRDMYKLKNLDGLILLEDEVDPEKAISEPHSENEYQYVYKVTTNVEGLVYADDGVDIRKGPSTVYEKVGHLDKDTVFKYKYAMGDPSGTTNVYVDTGSVKGWVDILDGKVLQTNTSKFITYKEVDMGCAKIPKNTILSPKYVSDKWKHSALVEYGSCKNLINYFRGVDGLVMLSNSNYVANTELDIYEYYDNGGEKVATIPANGNFVLMANASIQGDLQGNIYVSYNDKKGWVKSEYENYKRDENTSKNEEIEKEITIEEEEKDEKEDTKLVDTDKKETNLNPVDYVSMYVIIGLSVALITVIIVILVNRKKKIINSEKNDTEENS